jgi:acyl-CoA thioester hydrolase
MKKNPVAVKKSTSYRVIYGDTDQMGIVYYANYLRWFEKGRSEFLREVGLPYTIIEERGFHFPVVEVSCRYLEPARYDDLVQIETALVERGRASLTFDYTLRRDSGRSTIATGITKHACTDRAGRIIRIPQIVLDALEKAAV